MLILGHSPDHDDALAFAALAEQRIDTRGFDFERVVGDIPTLDEWARDGKLDVTTISLQCYPHVQDTYVLLPDGARVTSGRGPLVVARRELSRRELLEAEIAVPRELPTAALLLRLWLGTFRARVVPAERVAGEVREGRVGAGLTPEADGLATCADLGEWWLLETGLPLPLAVAVARRDIGAHRLRDLSLVVRDSIRAGLGTRACDDGGERRHAVRELLTRADALGVYSQPVRVEFVE